MSKRTKYVPKHRHVPEPTPTESQPSALLRGPRTALRTGVLMTSVAVAVTGVAVSGGVFSSPVRVANTAHEVGSDVASGQAGHADQAGHAAQAAQADLAARAVARDRQAVTSRSADRRAEADPAKVSALSATSGPARTSSVDVSAGDPKDIARALLPKFGFGSDQFGCLDSLWTRESNWNVHAHNASSGAHGIPQALPGSKMASAGSNWESDPVTQITWGLGYIRDRYGSPCGAWAHSESNGWY